MNIRVTYDWEGGGGGEGGEEEALATLLFFFPQRRMNHGLTSAVVTAWKIKNESPMKAMTTMPLPGSMGKTVGCQFLYLLTAQAGGVIVWGGFIIILRVTRGDEITQELAPSAIKHILFACPRTLQRPLCSLHRHRVSNETPPTFIKDPSTYPWTPLPPAVHYFHYLLWENHTLKRIRLILSIINLYFDNIEEEFLHVMT